MEIKIETKSNYKIISLNGEFSGTVTCSEIIEKFKLTNEGNNDSIIIDLENVVYADSLAVGVLLFCLKEVEKTGGKLVLANINPHIRKIIYISKLHTRMEIFESLKDAENYAF